MPDDPTAGRITEPTALFEGVAAVGSLLSLAVQKARSTPTRGCLGRA